MLLFIIGMEMRLQSFRKSLPLALGVTAGHHRRHRLVGDAVHRAWCMAKCWAAR